MAFNLDHFQLQFSQSDWSRQLAGAAQRLQPAGFGGPIQFTQGAAASIISGDHVARVADAGFSRLASGQAAAANSIVAATQASGDQMAAATQASADQISGGLNMLGVASVVQTATLAYGLYKVHDELKSIHQEISWFGQTLVQLGLEQRIQAERQTEVSKEILKALHESRRIEARQLIEQGERNAQAGFLEDAVDRFTKSLEYDNTDPIAWGNIALLHVKQGRVDDGEAAYKRVLAFASAQPILEAEAIRSYARLLGASERWSEASTLLSTLGARLAGC